MKVGFVSLGCPKNLVDTEVMMGHLAARGHVLTSSPEEAEAIVVNTCGFIGPAREESVNTILEMARFKSGGSARRLIVTGCLVERHRDEIRAEMPEVDAVLGTNEIESIVAACEGSPAGPARAPYLYHDATPRILATPSHYAYIKIAEGCDHPCSFCVIPQFRGAFRSRTPDSVAAEAASLFARGVREINLIGQDTTCYGEDLGIRDGLALLLERLARMPAARGNWIRFLYAYPNRITQRLLDVIAGYAPVAKYIDVPLQHASRNVLKRMKRGQSGDAFLKLIERIRRTVPGIAVRTSMIVGFPGETDSDFEELCRFVEAAQFDRLGVFSYSDEETAPSFRLGNKVPARVVYNRRRRLMSVQRRISKARNRRLVGQEFPVLVEGLSPETDLLWQARAQTQAPDIDGVCLVNDVEGPPPRAGEMRRFRVTAAHDYDVVGTLLETRAVRPVDELRILAAHP